MRFSGLAIFSMLALATLAAGAEARPVITAISPAAAPHGSTITITGSGFAADNTVTVGSYRIGHVPVSGGVGMGGTAPGPIGVSCVVGKKCGIQAGGGGLTQTLDIRIPTWMVPGTYRVRVSTFEGRSASTRLVVLP
jgi:hypothetical protein